MLALYLLWNRKLVTERKKSKMGKEAGGRNGIKQKSIILESSHGIEKFVLPLL